MTGETLLPRRHFRLRFLLLLWSGLPGAAAAQSVVSQCVAVLPARTREDIAPGVRLEADSTIVKMFEPLILREDPARGPSWQQLDSVWQADSLALANTLAAMITDPLEFGAWVAMSAAEIYRRLGGPADLILWAFDYPTQDERRTEILAALSAELTSDQQESLLRQACLTGATLEAVGGQLTTWRRLGAQVDAPLWYQAGIAELRLMQRLLKGDQRRAFDTIIGPLLRDADRAGY